MQWKHTRTRIRIKYFHFLPWINIQRVCRMEQDHTIHHLTILLIIYTIHIFLDIHAYPKGFPVIFLFMTYLITLIIRIIPLQEQRLVLQSTIQEGRLNCNLLFNELSPLKKSYSVHKYTYIHTCTLYFINFRLLTCYSCSQSLRCFYSANLCT